MGCDIERLRAWCESQEIDPEDCRILICFDN